MMRKSNPTIYHKDSPESEANDRLGFNMIDKDGDGFITAADLREFHIDFKEYVRYKPIEEVYSGMNS